MPNGRMASYTARKIWFEKLFPYLNDEKTILIGHSLGATFLLKYLSENIFPQSISKLCLVASSIDEETGYDKRHYLGDFVWDF
jgi:predicted alpha/beta hydrolase family esterase